MTNPRRVFRQAQYQNPGCPRLNNEISRQVPGPASFSLLGDWLEFRRNPLRLMCQWRREYGDLMRFRLGTRPFFLLSHPKLAEELLIGSADDFAKLGQTSKSTGFSLVFGNGLVTSYGDLWCRQRKLIQPVFQRRNVAAFGGRMAACGQDLLARWDRLESGQTVLIGQEMMRLTLEIITQTMFNRSVLEQSEQLSLALDTVLRYATETIRNPLMLPLSVPTPANRRFKRALALLDGVIYRIIEERRENGERRDDFLDLLLAAKDAGEGMPDRLLRDEVLTVFVAGHETTATALAWTWCLLAQSPKALARLHRELDEVLQGRQPRVDDLPNLPWTRAVFDEALRLYPPAPGILRIALADVELGGFRLPKGSLVFANFYNIHRHPDFWEESDAFRPERFLPESPKPDHKLAYMPFSAGQRVCAGNHFALTEGPLLIAIIAQRYELQLAPGQSVEPVLHATLKLKSGLRMTLRRRSSCRF